LQPRSTSKIKTVFQQIICCRKQKGGPELLLWERCADDFPQITVPDLWRTRWTWRT
jgi:hypothetical protein